MNKTGQYFPRHDLPQSPSVGLLPRRAFCAWMTASRPGWLIEPTCPSPGSDQLCVSICSLLRPRQITLAPAPGLITLLQDDGSTTLWEATEGASLHVRLLHAGLCWSAQGGLQREPEAVVRRQLRILMKGDFQLRIGSGWLRTFCGALSIQSQSQRLLLLLSMPLEELVAEAVFAEMSPMPPLPALCAQAIAARSYALGHLQRHRREGFDFCDTTHCQHLRGSRLPQICRQAASSTHSLILQYAGQVIPAYYSAVCRGRLLTIPPKEADQSPYPCQEVVCEPCARRRRQDPDQRATHPLTGAAQGHGIGMCQAGALELAEQGWSWQRILRHYFPLVEIAPWTARQWASRFPFANPGIWF